jgi:hypothetical protein
LAILSIRNLDFLIFPTCALLTPTFPQFKKK